MMTLENILTAFTVAVILFCVMSRFFRKRLRMVRDRLSLSLLLGCLLFAGLEGQSQTGPQGQSMTSPVAQATPRVYLVMSNLDVTNGGFFGTGTITNTNGFGALGLGNLTNALGGYSWLTNATVAYFAPTIIPPTGAHAIGLTCIIENTNDYLQASNMVITVYAAYDISGGATYTASSRYGEFFSAAPIFTWTIANLTNGIYTTNIPFGTWDPATALGYTITNQATRTAGSAWSNSFVTLLQTDTP